MSECVFCSIPERRVFARTKFFFIVEDKFPVSKGHCLIISKRHVASYFDLTKEEKIDLIEATNKIAPDWFDTTITGYNIGINIGEDAGQTVMHFHQHVIPRRRGDMENPAGGVRGVIPAKQNYQLPTGNFLIDEPERRERVDLQFALNLPHEFELHLEGVVPLKARENGFPYTLDDNPNAQVEATQFYGELAKIKSLKLYNDVCLDGPLIISFEDGIQDELVRFEGQDYKAVSVIGKMGMYTGLEGNRVNRQPSVLNRERQFPFIQGLNPERFPWYRLIIDAQFKPKIINQRLRLCVTDVVADRRIHKWRHFVDIHNQE